MLQITDTIAMIIGETTRDSLRKKNHIKKKMISIDSGAEIAIWINISTPKLSSATGRPVMK